MYLLGGVSALDRIVFRYEGTLGKSRLGTGGLDFQSGLLAPRCKVRLAFYTKNHDSLNLAEADVQIRQSGLSPSAF